MDPVMDDPRTKRGKREVRRERIGSIRLLDFDVGGFCSLLLFEDDSRSID